MMRSPTGKPTTAICCLCVMLGCFLGAYGQQPLASITGPSGPVSEASGSVNVCVSVTNANNIPDGGVEIEVIVIAGQSTATTDDYELQEQPLTFMPGTSSRCVPIILVQDNLVEGSVPETMLVRIIVTNSQLVQPDLQSDIVTIMIEDSDKLEIGFTQSSYSVQEEIVSFDLCTRIENGRLASSAGPITVEIIRTGGTATDADYGMDSSNYVFTSDMVVNIRCIQVTIEDDAIIEANETISITLREQSTSSVTFTIQSAEITIKDNDFATVTIDPRELTIIEGNNTMNTTLELCVVLSNVKDGVDRDVIVNITISEETATGQNDFALLSNSVSFPDDARLNDDQCFQLLIIGDNFIEIDEVFRVNISTFFPDLVGDPGSATVTIIHDGDNICSALENPVNGTVVVTGSTVGSIATYSCNMDYVLIGPRERNCTDAGWSGQDPLCLRMCNPLRIANGDVTVDADQYVEGAIATYVCDPGYGLNTDVMNSRQCQSSGQWNGTDPICLVDCGRLNNPDNGRVAFVSTVEGAMATYSCNFGFELFGSRVRTCDSNGLWLGISPICSGADFIRPGWMMLALTLIIIALSTNLLS